MQAPIGINCDPDGCQQFGRFVFFIYSGHQACSDSPTGGFLLLLNTL